MPEFFRGIGAARIGAMAGVAAALTGFFLYVFGLIAEPPKAILFSGLEGRDASAVISKLDALNVPYEQKGDGGTIGGITKEAWPRALSSGSTCATTTWMFPIPPLVAQAF